jgi:hypothetical protein
VGNHGSTPAEITSVMSDPQAPDGVGISPGMMIQSGQWISTFLRLPGPLPNATLTVTATWGDDTDTATATVSIDWACGPFYTVVNTCDTMAFTFLAPPATRTDGEAGLNGEYRADLWSVATNGGLLAELAEFDMKQGDGHRSLVFPQPRDSR